MKTWTKLGVLGVYLIFFFNRKIDCNEIDKHYGREMEISFGNQKRIRIHNLVGP